jgi:superfamily II DNA helicase RecQ
MIPKQEPAQEHPSVLILNAVADYERQLGIGSLALVLKGSKSKRVLNRQLYASKVFGALFYRPLDVIENFIKQLVVQKYLKIVNIGERYVVPVLVLTTAGREALEQGHDISLQVVRTPPALNESARITVQIFQTLRSVAKVAELRGLAQSTVWDHLITAVKLDKLKATDVVEPQKVQLILKTKDRLKPKGLKELKAALPEDITYEELRCAISGLQEIEQPGMNRRE